MFLKTFIIKSTMSRINRFVRTLFPRFSSSSSNFLPQESLNIKPPDLDLDYLCNPKNCEEISNNITARKGLGNIQLVQSLKSNLDALASNDVNRESTLKELISEALKIPNKTHPAVQAYGEDPKIVEEVGSKRQFDFKAREFEAIAKQLKLIRLDQLGNVSGNRSYFFLGQLAELQQALINYTVHELLRRDFQLFSVPDLLERHVIESCGMNTRGARNQVYNLDPHTDICLSGTSEMALGGYFSNKVLEEKELPVKVAAISRCYRAETSSTTDERGIFRVHEFTKVEMFAVSTPEQSEKLLEEFLTTEKILFENLGLHFKIIDMPPHELGAPAYRKYDIEAWLPGRKLYGEISSCSNCTDFQARRLGIKYKSGDDLKYVHTVNGTACAVPRMLIALTETYQGGKGTIEVPEVLRRWMRGATVIEKQKQIPELKLVKMKQ